MSDYLFGYSVPPPRLGLHQLEQRSTWTGLDPEFRRRLLALFDASGGKVGIGGGWRSRAEQAKAYAAEQIAHPGSKRFAPPGKSWHEESTPEGKGLAADLIGDLPLAHRLGPIYGLRDFAANSFPEPWHFQPVELPTARALDAVASLDRWPVPVDLTSPVPTIKPVAIPEEGPVIRVRFKGYANVFSHDGGSYSHLSGAINQAYANVPLVESEYHEQALACALHQSGLTMNDMVSTPDGS